MVKTERVTLLLFMVICRCGGSIEDWVPVASVKRGKEFLRIADIFFGVGVDDRFTGVFTLFFLSLKGFIF